MEYWSITTERKRCNSIRKENGLKELSYPMFYNHYEHKNDFEKMLTIQPKHWGYRPWSRDWKTILPKDIIDNMLYAVLELWYDRKDICRSNGVANHYLNNYIRKLNS